MTERPILMSAPMVRAIVEGRKTQMRRAMKPAPEFCNGGWVMRGYERGQQVYSGPFDPIEYANAEPGAWFAHSGCPYGIPGNRLWVREMWRTSCHLDDWSPKQVVAIYVNHEPVSIQYIADGKESFPCCSEWGKNRPGMFMPRSFSRLTLEVTGVRMERVQEISEEDAKAEGVTANPEPSADARKFINDLHAMKMQTDGHYFNYKKLWDSLNGKRGFGWDKNPWVWVIEFKRI